VADGAARADEEFREYAAARAGQLFRIAYLTCGDWHEAEDLVQTTLAKLYAVWPRVRRSHAESARQHGEILLALADGDAAAASARTYKHIMGAPPV